MRQHGDVRQALLAEAVDRSNGLGHLHEREDVLLHARATGAGDADQRDAVGDRVVRGQAEALAHDAAHRAAHEREVHHGEGGITADDASVASDERVAEARLQLGVHQTIGVRLEVNEGERVGRAQVAADLHEGAGVYELVDALHRAHHEVMATLGADALCMAQLVVAIVRATLGARVRMAAPATLLATLALHIDLDGRHRSRCSLNRSITSDALWPPKPKPLDSATSMDCSRITFGM